LNFRSFNGHGESPFVYYTHRCSTFQAKEKATFAAFGIYNHRLTLDL
jgi:hypothetical protein